MSAAAKLKAEAIAEAIRVEGRHATIEEGAEGVWVCVTRPGAPAGSMVSYWLSHHWILGPHQQGGDPAQILIEAQWCIDTLALLKSFAASWDAEAEEEATRDPHEAAAEREAERDADAFEKAQLDKLDAQKNGDHLP